MKYIAFLILCVSINAQAKTVAESSDGTIMLTDEQCQGHKDSQFTYQIAGEKVIALGCWKAEKQDVLILWNNNTLKHYSYTDWKLNGTKS